MIYLNIYNLPSLLELEKFCSLFFLLRIIYVKKTSKSMKENYSLMKSTHSIKKKKVKNILQFHFFIHLKITKLQQRLNLFVRNPSLFKKAKQKSSIIKVTKARKKKRIKGFKMKDR